MLHCVAIGDPKPTVWWDKNSEVNAWDVNRFEVLFFMNVSVQLMVETIYIFKYIKAINAFIKVGFRLLSTETTFN